MSRNQHELDHACARMMSIAFFVDTQSKKGRIPHFAVTRPLGEF
jgi:hypothetical protein